VTDQNTSATSHVPADWGKGYGRLAGKTALVTGSTRGLGRTIAEWLAREGASIVVSGREGADIDASVAAIRALGVEAWGIPADLARVEEAHALAIQALATVESLDIVVNNAGMSIPQSFWDVTDAEYEYQSNVNLRSPFVICQHLARSWIARGARGRIVNVSTVGVFKGHTDKMVYNMAKAGVQTMTRNMVVRAGAVRHHRQLRGAWLGTRPAKHGLAGSTRGARARQGRDSARALRPGRGHCHRRRLLLPPGNRVDVRSDAPGRWRSHLGPARLA